MAGVVHRDVADGLPPAFGMNAGQIPLCRSQRTQQRQVCVPEDAKHFNGDGGTGTTPRGDLLPGTNIGSFGRRIRNLAELNQFIGDYNNQFAGHLTPAGQRLVSAGIFSEAQLIALGGAMPFIPLVPLTNADPFENVFYADYKLSRPVKIWKEGWSLEPSLSIFNVFNNAPLNSYTGLAIPNVSATTGRTGSVVTNFGALNYDYANPQAADIANHNDLSRTRGAVVQRISRSHFPPHR